MKPLPLVAVSALVIGQAAAVANAPPPFEGIAAQVQLASALAALGLIIYRIGMLRQEMSDTKHNVAAQVARNHEETNRRLEAIERHLASIDRFMAASIEQRVSAERWRARVDTTLEHHRQLFQDLARVGQPEVT